MPYSPELAIRITDTSLRDGSHAKHHQFTEDDVRVVVGALDAAGHGSHGHRSSRRKSVSAPRRKLGTTKMTP